METASFDRITKLFAERRTNRRSTVLAAGAGVAALGFAGIRHASAQDATPDTAPDAAATPVDGTTKSPNDPSFLFLQSFQSGTFTPKEGSSDTFTLTLDQGLGQTVYFSDRPERIVGASPTAQFLTQFPFDIDNPPNAALVAETESGATDVIVIELTSPSYDLETRTATYDAMVLNDYEKLGATFQEKPKGATDLPASFGAASLFIDDCSDAIIDCNVNPIDVPDGDPGNLGSHGMCYDWSAVQCRPCGGIDQYTALCNSTFPTDCQDQCTAAPECKTTFCS